MVKVLCYKSEGRWFDPSWCHWNFSLTKSFRSHYGLGLNQPLTEMSTRSISWGKDSRCIRLTTYHHPVPLSRNLGTLTSWSPLGLSRPVMGLLYLYLFYKHITLSGVACFAEICCYTSFLYCKVSGISSCGCHVVVDVQNVEAW